MKNALDGPKCARHHNNHSVFRTGSCSVVGALKPTLHEGDHFVVLRFLGNRLHVLQPSLTPSIGP